MPPRFLTLAGLAFACLATGCVLDSQSRAGRGRTQSDRLQRHYDDLRGGRFAVVADFEEAAHRELFSLEGAGEVDVDPKAGVTDTGGACLKIILADRDATLVADNGSAQDWLLKRDWRPYDLLLMQVHSPVEATQLDIVIASGGVPGVGEAHSLVPLHAGWNLLRLDLGEAADYVALDDVRQLRWSVPGQDGRLELKIDDVVLTDNKTEVFNTPEGEAGRLYVVQQGRRLRVGAVGRFELAFANGQIVRWYALDRDPLRLADLVGRGNTIGPVPVVLPDDDPENDSRERDWPAGFASLGKLVQTRQRVTEAGEVRIVVECTWLYSDHQTGFDDNAPRVAWTYVVYPSGHVFVTVESTSAFGAFAPGHLGLFVSRAPLDGLTVSTHEPGGLRDAPDIAHVAYAWSAAPDGGAGLLFVLHDSRKGPQLRYLPAGGEARAGFLASGGAVERPIDRWNCLLGVWRDQEEGPAPEAVAASYCAAPRFEFLVGDLVRTTSGDLDGDGFNERWGAFMLATDANRVQLQIHGRASRLVAPTFCVTESAGREGWVYVNYAIHEPVARDVDGNLVFQISETLETDTTVEVYLKNAAGTK